MKNLKTIVFTAILATSSFISIAQKSINLNTEGKEGKFTRFEDLKWFTAFDGFPIEFAIATGETFKTAHATYGKFPAHLITPAHKHSNSYRAVVIQGVMTNPMSNDKGSPKELGPGSTWYVPANEEHTTGCISDTPCIFYMYQDVPFDFIPTKK